MILGQNTKQYVEFLVCDENDVPLDSSTFTEVEFTFNTTKSKNQLIKRWPEDTSIIYNTDTGIFSVLLTERDTQNWSEQIPVQVRVKFSDGLIDSSDPELWNMRPCLNKEVIEND